MELISWMWVYDKRYFFEVQHTKSRIIVAWIFPLVFTVTAFFNILLDGKFKHDPSLYLTVLVSAVVKVLCFGILINRQIYSNEIDLIWRSKVQVNSRVGNMLLLMTLVTFCLSLQQNSFHQWSWMYIYLATAYCSVSYVVVFIGIGVIFKLSIILQFSLCPLGLLNRLKEQRGQSNDIRQFRIDI